MSSQPVFAFMPQCVYYVGNKPTNNLNQCRQSISECLRKSFLQFCQLKLTKMAENGQGSSNQPSQERQAFQFIEIASENEEKSSVQNNQKEHQIPLQENFQQKIPSSADQDSLSKNLNSLKSPSLSTPQLSDKLKQPEGNQQKIDFDHHKEKFYSPIEEQEVEMVGAPLFGALDHEAIKRKRENLKLREVEDWSLLNKKNRHQRRELNKLNR